MHFSTSTLCGCVLSAFWLTGATATPFPKKHHHPAHPTAPAPPAPAPATEKALAVYLMTNKAQNAVVAISVCDDGTLGKMTTTMTGGAGGNEVDATKFTPNSPDALASQGSVQVAGNLLFALNANSSTLSMFSINPADPTQLTMVGQPACTVGDFPVTVAANADLGIACVGTTGVSAGVTCANFDATTGLGTFDALRPFNLNQTNPPTGPLNSVAQVLFSDDLSQLITTVKGDPTAAVANPGFVATFAVDAAAKSVSSQGVMTSPAGSAVLFGTATIPGTSNLLATDASFGAFILNGNDLATPIANTTIADQVATCWAVFSSVTGTGFVTDVAVSHLVEIDPTDGSIVSVTDPNNNGQGMIDFHATGNNIYALSPGNGTVGAAVTVFDVSGGRGSAKAVQNFLLGAGVDANAEGMAVFASSA